MTQTIRKKLGEGLSQKLFGQAELLVSHRGKITIHEHVTPSGNPAIYYDLASLTKPLCTALLCLVLHGQKKLHLDHTVAEYVAAPNLEKTPLENLLNHTSGLIDWFAFYKQFIASKKPDYAKNRAMILKQILADHKLMATPGRTVYSDLGYMVLGAIVEDIAGTPLDTLFSGNIAGKLGITGQIFFRPVGESHPVPRTRCVASETGANGSAFVQGEVMDENCRVMGGVAGHAGLFGTAGAIDRILVDLRAAQTDGGQLTDHRHFDLFCRPDPDRRWNERRFTLGFDTPTQGQSQSGTMFSKNSIGHLGFSGTSFWWDLDRDFWIILLTNRCLYGRDNTAFSLFRPELHDLIVKECFETPAPKGIP